MRPLRKSKLVNQESVEEIKKPKKEIKKEIKDSKTEKEQEVIKNEEELKSYILKFFKENEIKKETAKNLEALGTPIKTYMSKNNLATIETDGVKAAYSIATTYGFDEEILIPILKNILPKEILEKVVVTKEIVDFDALDDANYHKQFDINKIIKAQTVKTVAKLVVSKIKAKKNPFFK